jgi:hypothetical protein
MGGTPWHTVEEAWGSREAWTAELLREACAGGCCPTAAKPALAAVEVQSRLFLGARVDVVSLDGRTSARDYDDRGCPRLDAVLGDRRVVAVMDPPRKDMAMCRDGSLADALDGAWGGRAAAPSGWSWSAPAEILVRVCPPPPAPP